MLRGSSWRGWKTRPWGKRLFSSETFETFEEASSRLRDRLTSSAADSPAKTSPSPARAPASKASEADSSSSSCAWLTRYDLDTCSWKTCQGLLDVGLTPSLPALPRAGSMRSGYVYERPTWAPRIDVSGGSAWPTPQVGTGPNSHGQISGDFRNRMEELTANWPTAGANDHKGSSKPGQRRHQLDQATENWPTPQATDDQRDRQSDEGVRKWKDRPNSGSELAIEVRLWQTPKDSTGGNVSRGGDRKDELLLAGQAQSFPRGQMTIEDGDVVFIDANGLRRRLNPAFVSWLMGNPWWWTRAEPISFAAQEMELWFSRQRWLFESFFAGPVPTGRDLAR